MCHKTLPPFSQQASWSHFIAGHYLERGGGGARCSPACGKPLSQVVYALRHMETALMQGVEVDERVKLGRRMRVEETGSWEEGRTKRESSAGRVKCFILKQCRQGQCKYT